MNRIIIAVLVIVAIAAVLFFANSGTTAAELADELKGKMDNFEVARGKATDKLADNTQKTIEKLSGDSPDMEGASSVLQQAQEDFSSAISQLEEELGAAVADGKALFAELDREIAKVNNPDVKAAKLEHINDVKQRWSQVYAEAAQRVAQLKNLQKETADLQILLHIETTLAKLEKNIERIRGISVQAQQLLAKIDRLKAGSTPLVSPGG